MKLKNRILKLKKYETKKQNIEVKKTMKHISILHTGGTIASKVDYGTFFLFWEK